MNNTIGAPGILGATCATGIMEKDRNNTISKDGERNKDDGFILEEGEILEDRGKNTEAAVASNLGAMVVMVKSTGGNHLVDSKDKKNKNNNKSRN